MTNYINGKWIEGDSEIFSSINGGSGKTIWKGNNSSSHQVDLAVASAKNALKNWKMIGLESRIKIVRRFADLIEEYINDLARKISEETGKILWEAKTEALAVKSKIEISIKAYHERTITKSKELIGSKTVIRYQPHGVVAIFGPYNFPAHLPNGHIVPALIAGNAVVFKPSEFTPATAEFIVKMWEKAGIPKGILNLIQGEKDTGISLSKHPDINGLFFTGSSRTGKMIHQQFGGQPSKILALEMGGNNPLIIREVKNQKAAVYDSILSSFITTGQRCTCARRIFVPQSNWGNQFISSFVETARHLKVGEWDEKPAPFMGTLISEQAADRILNSQNELITQGAICLLEAKKIKLNTGLISPSILDVTSLKELPDEEYFGPLVQIIRYTFFQNAIDQANNTRFGLSAGLFSDDAKDYELFINEINAGIMNWNKPTTGAVGSAPFGGIGESGNHRPSAYFAADYSAYPVASVEAKGLQLPESLSPGIELK